MKIELEPLTNTEKRKIIVHLLDDEDVIDTLTLEITREQEPKLFDIEHEGYLYFLQGINEQKIIHHVEHKIKQLFVKRYSLVNNDQNLFSYIQLTADMEHDTLSSIETLFYMYANNKLNTYSREECMRVAVEYSFDDLLDRLNSNEIESIKNKEISIMMNDVKTRLRLQIERRLVWLSIFNFQIILNRFIL